MGVAVVTLAVGLVVGYVGQRSRLCFIGGIRDFVLIRDTSLLKGVIAFAATAWVLFPIARVIGGEPSPGVTSIDVVGVGLTAVGAAGVGFVSTLANGCPLRQHVLAAQGVVSSMWYVVGFFVGAVVFDLWTAPILLRVLP